ncbi:MAG: hypothetical protein MMC33_003312 [Icmadophila ericetorum]|nr:hypothetical protein [Icmadophila ericetorum]
MPVLGVTKHRDQRRHSKRPNFTTGENHFAQVETMMFNASAPLPPLATPKHGVQRSNSKVKKELLKLVSYQTKANKPAHHSSQPTTMAVDTSSARSFLVKTGMMSLHRKKNSTDSTISLDSKADSGKQQKTDNDAKKHSLIGDGRPADDGPTTLTLKGITEGVELSMSPVVEESTKFNVVFEGLPDYRTNPNINESLIDPEFLEKAFGISMEPEEDHSLFAPAASDSTAESTTRQSSKDSFFADVPVRMGSDAKDMRPRIQVSIPERKTSTSASARAGRQYGNGTPGSISPPSTTTQQHRFNGARLSIISPLSVVEMPKPRRPFSAMSLEGMEIPASKNDKHHNNNNNNNNEALSKSIRSASSDDASERDGKSSSANASPRSSMSSMASDTMLVVKVVKRQEDGKAANPSTSRSPKTAYAQHHLQTPSPSQGPKAARSVASLQEPSSPPKVLHTKDSTTSLSSGSTATRLNKNKPLPPEPGIVNIAPLNVASSSSPSRSSSMTARQRAPAPLRVQEPCGGGNMNMNISRRSSRASTLRSKYTPKDLDALDDAFQRNMPLKGSVGTPYSSTSTPTLSQVELALESQLDTIAEVSPHNSTIIPHVRDPLQISRGPMRMEPSRKAPAPPAVAMSPSRESRKDTNLSIRTISPSPDRYESPRQRNKRAASGNHVVNQLRAAGSMAEPANKRTSMAIMKSNNKANRILGNDVLVAPYPLERKESMDSWSSLSPHMHTTCSSPTMSFETHTPESELSAADAQTEEIRQRLKLLSPKDDAIEIFQQFHEENAASRLTYRLPFAVLRKDEIPENSYNGNPQNCPSHEHNRKPQAFIAELEASVYVPPVPPAPVELEDTSTQTPVLANFNERSIPEEQEIEFVAIPPTPGPLPETRSIEKDAQETEKLGAENILKPTRSVRARSLASLAMSEIPDLYAELPGSTSMRPSMTPEEVEQLISADAAERVLLRILMSLGNLGDLFSAATVSRGFYRTFKKNELSLLKNSLWHMSPAAWELREMTVPRSGSKLYAPSQYLKDYTRDLLAMVELKSMMLEHCKSFLRAETIRGLAGETDQSAIIDDAFWRVWTFCRLFGCGTGREDDVVGQMDWLRGGALARQSTDTRTMALNDSVSMNSVLINPPAGFGWGNSERGLSAEMLYDMTEIWTCLGVLVRGYQGRRKEAREYGVFDNANVAVGDVDKENAVLEEWTSYLLTLSPGTVLQVKSPTTPTQSTFNHARSHGYTKWTPPIDGTSRSTFLKEAVSRVYEEKIIAMQDNQSPTSTHSSDTSLSQASKTGATSTTIAVTSPASPNAASKQRTALLAAEMKAKKQDPSYSLIPTCEERPMSKYPQVLARLDSPSRPPPLLTNSSSASAATTYTFSSQPLRPSTPLSQQFHSKLPKNLNLANKFLRLQTKVQDKTYWKASKTANHATSTTSPISPPQSALSSTERLPFSAASNERLPFSTISTSSLPFSNTTTYSIPGSIPVNIPHPIGLQQIQVPTGPQVVDPIDISLNNLLVMGYPEWEAKKALAESDSGNSVDFDAAVQILERWGIRREIYRPPVESVESFGSSGGSAGNGNGTSGGRVREVVSAFESGRDKGSRREKEREKEVSKERREKRKVDKERGLGLRLARMG